LGHEHTVLPMGSDGRRPTRPEGKFGHKLCEISRRVYDQFLFASQLGAASVKLGSETFLITPEGIDMLNLSVDHIVVVRSGHNHSHHGPSRYASIHKHFYESSAELIAIIGSSPPNLMAFTVTHREISNLMLTST
jgi:ribulose-5-phosphate 4-epimerase/fuculose-1-phosphate aldolase